MIGSLTSTPSIPISNVSSVSAKSQRQLSPAEYAVISVVVGVSVLALAIFLLYCYCFRSKGGAVTPREGEWPSMPSSGTIQEGRTQRDLNRPNSYRDSDYVDWPNDLFDEG